MSTFEKHKTGIIQLYEQGLSCREIAEIYGYKTPKSINDKLRSFGVKIRTSAEAKKAKKTYSESLFELIDSSWKAYFVGLLVTDGWVTRGDTIGISLVDEDAISMLSKASGKGYRTYKGKFCPLSPSALTQDFHRILFTSKKMVCDVKRFGLIENKTYREFKCTLYQSELIFLKDLVRGIIDGNGTFGFPSNKPGTMYCRIISHQESFLLQCKEWLLILGFSRVKVKPIKGTTNFQIEICGTNNAHLLKYGIYGRPYGMNRKRQKIYNCRLLERSRM